MRRSWGLQAKMTTSYVLVTVTATALVELVVTAVVLPWLARAEESGPPLGGDPIVVVEATSADYATRASMRVSRLGRLPTAGEFRLGDASATLAPGQARVADGGERVVIPYVATQPAGTSPMSLALLLTPDGSVVSSSYPALYGVGDRFDIPAGGVKSSGVAGDVRWATAPVSNFGGLTSTQADPAVLGVVYVQVPAAAPLVVPGPEAIRPAESQLSQLLVGALFGLLAVLAAAIPVGVIFGLLSTRGLIGRLRRLAASAEAVADGDLHLRIPSSSADEVGQLERTFNRMAERLTTAMDAERRLASANERARIARELHDSISQDLFSLSLLTGVLRKALPAGSPLRPQVDTMERTANGTMHEMQALLLELRPTALADAGLVPAVEQVCQDYRDRLGVVIDTDLQPIEAPPPVEHAALRIVQEALANAVKHAQPQRIALRLSWADGVLTVAVDDDGAGFDPARTHERRGLGLTLMRERVTELGGRFHLDSAPGEGTRLRIHLPTGQP